MGVKAVLRLTLLAGAALAAHGAPVQDDEVTDLHVGYVGAHALDDARSLMAKQEREGIFDVAVAVGQVGVTHTAGLNFYDDVVCARLGHDDVNGLYWCALGTGDYCFNGCFTHAAEPTQIFSKTALMKMSFRI